MDDDQLLQYLGLPTQGNSSPWAQMADQIPTVDASMNPALMAKMAQVTNAAKAGAKATGADQNKNIHPYVLANDKNSSVDRVLTPNYVDWGQIHNMLPQMKEDLGVNEQNGRVQKQLELLQQIAQAKPEQNLQGAYVIADMLNGNKTQLAKQYTPPPSPQDQAMMLAKLQNQADAQAGKLTSQDIQLAKNSVLQPNIMTNMDLMNTLAGMKYNNPQRQMLDVNQKEAQRQAELYNKNVGDALSKMNASLQDINAMVDKVGYSKGGQAAKIPLLGNMVTPDQNEFYQAARGMVLDYMASVKGERLTQQQIDATLAANGISPLAPPESIHTGLQLLKNRLGAMAQQQERTLPKGIALIKSQGGITSEDLPDLAGGQNSSSQTNFFDQWRKNRNSSGGK